MYKIVVFDMDDTLTKSRSTADDEMVKLFWALSNKYKVSIVTWWNFNQIEKQIIGHLDIENTYFENIFLFPTNGTKMMFFEDPKFVEKYSEDFTDEEVKLIENTFNKAIVELDLLPEKQFGPLLDNRWWQITYAALWKDVPLEIKDTWDSDSKKRLAIREYIKDDLKDFQIWVAGRSSIDVTRKGIDKAYAIKKIMEHLEIQKEEILFIWDCLFEWWNDYPVKAFWVDTKQVENPEDTKKIIKTLI